MHNRKNYKNCTIQNKIKPLLFCAACVLLAVFITGSPVFMPYAAHNMGATAIAAGEDFSIIAYLPEWNADKAYNIDWENITHIVYSFAIPQTDGTLLYHDTHNMTGKIISMAHKNNVSAILAIGGWGCENEFAQASSPDNVKQFAQNIINACTSRGFDGIDIDWEYPDAGTMHSFAELIRELRTLADQNNLSLSIAVHAGISDTLSVAGVSQYYEDEILMLADNINVMAYDAVMNGDHSPLTFYIASCQYWLNRLPREKIIMGVPFYSRPGAAPYRDIVSIYNDASMCDYIDSGGRRIYYNGIETICEKASVAVNENIGGMMIWEITQDSTHPDDSLLAAITRTVDGSQ